ncbi:MAG: hypothetical protein EBR62_07390 [Verrucomicrobia bacterium]|nr:hypothetical protein [Verrucomicrobiota bacterium]
MTDAPPRRRRAVNQPEGKTHDEIYALVEQSARQAEQAWQASTQIEQMLKDLTHAIGTESHDEYGQPVGTGIVGRLMRLERDVQRRFATWDGWAKTATGAAMAATVLGGVLWWLLHDKLEALLK